MKLASRKRIQKRLHHGLKLWAVDSLLMLKIDSQRYVDSLIATNRLAVLPKIQPRYRRVMAHAIVEHYNIALAQAKHDSDEMRKAILGLETKWYYWHEHAIRAGILEERRART